MTTEKKIKILHLEDLKSDAELIHRALKKGNFAFDTLLVDTKVNFIKALKEFSPDVILADHSLPSFNSNEALEIFHHTGLKIPFILITSAMSDEFAVDIIKRGANDYILKDRLNRLPTAIISLLEKFRLEKERTFFLEELVKNEQKFRALIENNTDGIVIISAHGEVTYASASVSKILGYSEEEIMQLDLLAIAHPDDMLAFANIFQQALASPGLTIYEHTGRMRHKDGAWRWLEATLTNLIDQPAIRGIVDNFRDVTTKKLAEDKIIQLSRLYAFLSQINQAIVRSSDEQTLFKEVCRIAFEVGKFKAGWIGLFDHKSAKINYVEEYGLFKEDLASFTNVVYENNDPQGNVLRTGTYYVCNNIQTDEALGHWKILASAREYNACIVLPVKKSGSIIGTFNLYASGINFFDAEEIALLTEATNDISFALDVFEKEKLKKQADEERAQSELRLKQAQQIAHFGNWEVDLLTGVCKWSDELRRIYGLTPVEDIACYEPGVSFIHPQDQAVVMEKIKAAKVGLHNTAFFHRIVTRQGSVRHIYTQCQFEFGPYGQPLVWHGVAHDVTEMKEVEIALTHSAANLQAIFDNTSEGFILTDSKGIIKYFNNASREIIQLNIEKNIEIGKTIFDFVKDDRKDNYKHVISRVLNGEIINYDHFYERKSGEVKWFQFNINPVFSKGIINGLSITSIDITERKNDEQKILTTSGDLQKALADLKKILDSSLDVICSINVEGQFVSMNAASENIWGYT
ncbi:MAG: PAS domain S-box protein, partial [Ferruginibacter sp.]